MNEIPGIKTSNISEMSREEENKLADYIYGELKKADQSLVYCADAFLAIIKKKEARHDEFIKRMKDWKIFLKKKGMEMESAVVVRALEIFVSLDKKDG